MENKKHSSDMQYYQIELKGYISPEWSEWFDNLTITHTPHGATRLSGFVRDQAALFGILLRTQNLGMTLLSVNAGNYLCHDPTIDCFGTNS